MNTKIQNIYVSKFLIITALVGVTEFIFFLFYALQKCNTPFIYWGILLIAVIFDLLLIKHLKNSNIPYIRISNAGLEWKEFKIPWSEINLITLRYASVWNFNAPRSDRGFPYLEIQTKNDKYKIGLKLLMDKERRKLLDAINEYDTIMYKGTKYSTNYMFILMAILGTVYIVGHILYFYNQFWR